MQKYQIVLSSLCPPPSLWIILMAVCSQNLTFNLAVKSFLGIDYNLRKNTGICFPIAEAVQISGTFFVIENERHNIMTEALFEHDQPSNSSVSIFEREDALKLIVKIQNLSAFDFTKGLVLFNQLDQAVVDFISGTDNTNS